MSGKRSRDVLSEDERPTISIQLDGGVAIHGVDLQLLSLLSSCARGLPADAVCWDLSKLLVEGQPVQRPTVISYLNSAYQHAYGEPFKEAAQPQQEETAAQKPKTRKQQRGQQQGEPEQQADQQAPAEAAAGVTTFAAMTQLLLFADAVGSTAPLLRACATGIDKLHVQLPTGAPLDLSIRTPYYWDHTSSSSSPQQLFMVTEQQLVLVVATVSPAAKAVLVQQVQAQTEALLYAAYKLQLAEVAEAVQKFISMQTCFSNSLLMGAMHAALSARVLDAAAGYTKLQEMLLLNHLVTQHCDFPTAFCPRGTLVPTDVPAEQRQPSKFTAVVVQEFMGSRPGQQVGVKLDPLTNTMMLGSQAHRLQAVVGPTVYVEDVKQMVLGPPAPVPAAD